MPTAAKQPQDRRPPARKQTASSKARQQKAMEEELNRGFALDDDDGRRLVVRLRDVRGDHEAALVEVIGTDFLGLIDRMNGRHGTDLLAALLWFARLVHGRDSKTYAETLPEVGYADYINRNIEEPEADDGGPKASAAN